jgi:hypothetical protein
MNTPHRIALPEVTRAAVEALAAEVGRPVLDVVTDLQATAATLGDSEATLEKLCAIKADLIAAARPRQLIARFAAGVEATDDGLGAILVYLIETAGDPVFVLEVNGGELPEYVPAQYATAKRAIRTAADLCLTTIYDEVVAITETGEEDEDDQGTRETGGVAS